MAGGLQPPLLGGLFIGVLSALPFVSALNGCCCLWVVAGGVLTTYLVQERSRVSITAGSAAVSGLLAGVVGAIVGALLSAVISLFQGLSFGATFEEALQQAGDAPLPVVRALEWLRDLPEIVLFGLLLAITLLVFPVFSMLGGLLGVALFKRNPPPPPPGTVEVLPPE